MANSSITCFGSRFYADDSADCDGCTPLTTQETGDGLQPLDRGTGTANRFMLRLGFNNNNDAIHNETNQLRYSLNGAAAVNVNASSSVIRSTTGQPADDDPCNTSILTGGSGDFDTNGGTYDEVDGTAGGVTAKLDYGEWQYCIYMVSGSIASI
ncbi:MAG: hypothetical protein ACYTEX_24780 [Planctomycetota bacterium]